MWLAFNGGQDNGLREGFVPTVFQRIHTPEDKLSWLKGADVARFGLFIADLALNLDKKLVSMRPPAPLVEPEEAEPEETDEPAVAPEAEADAPASE